MENRRLYIQLICLLFFIGYCKSQDEIGSKCKNSSMRGICTNIVNCNIAKDQVKRSGKHNLKRCGFDRINEIVCCPDADLKMPDNENDKDYDTGDTPYIFHSGENSGETMQQNRFPKRKSQQACDDYSRVFKTPTFHIVDGEDADESEFPHMAALGYPSDHGIEIQCGGTIVSKKYVLTAAHCITGARVDPTRVRMGMTLLNDTDALEVDVKRIKVHEAYKSDTKHNDIALIELAQEIELSSTMNAACLYLDNDDPKEMIVSGWGTVSIAAEDSRSNILQKATLVPFPLNQCNVTYATRSLGSKTIDTTQICAYHNTSDSCLGDSGGPLQIRNKKGSYSIVGIISYGSGCANKGVPGIYTRVSRYVDWIENIVWS